MTRSPWFWFALIMGGTILLVVFLESRFPGTLSDPDNRMHLIYRLGWIALIGSSLIFGWRSRPKSALRNLAIWALIFLVAVGFFAFRRDATLIGQRIMSELSPTQGTMVEGGAMEFTTGPDGHFRIQALVNGSRVTFMLDTGATDIVLAPDDARRLGFDPDQLDYNQLAQTANGTVRGASVELQDLSVGSIGFRNVPATVNGADMSDSLLGMAFLNRLRGWRVENGVLVLLP